MRVSFRHLAAATALLALAACSDNITTPTSGTARNLTAETAPKFDYGNSGSSSFGRQTADFTVRGKGGSFDVGDFLTINFPQGSICRPTASDTAPCVALGDNESIAIHATLSLSTTGISVDFTHMRFVSDKVVTLSTDIFAPLIRANRDYFAAHPSALRPLAMYYTPSLGAAPVADYITDSSLITHINLTTGIVSRRIKHTSGYLMGAGTPCDPGPNEPDCVEVGRDQ